MDRFIMALTWLGRESELEEDEEILEDFGIFNFEEEN